MEIKKVFRETIPEGRLIGKCYTAKEDFGSKWGVFWQNDWFSLLEQAGGNASFDYLGMKRIRNDQLEYWIGMLFAPGAAVPEEFEYADIETMDYAVFWLSGNDNGDLLSMESHNRCLAQISEHGWSRKEDGWCIERYNCPRFTSKDAQGNFVIDYYLSLEGKV